MSPEKKKPYSNGRCFSSLNIHEKHPAWASNNSSNSQGSGAFKDHSIYLETFSVRYKLNLKCLITHCNVVFYSKL